MTPEEVAGSVGQLVSLPRAYHRISEMMDDPRYGAADIGKVIAHEPALTARVLRMVNSAYYHFPSKIDNIPLAITVLGTRACATWYWPPPSPAPSPRSAASWWMCPTSGTTASTAASWPACSASG